MGKKMCNLNSRVTFRTFITDERIKAMGITEVYLHSMPCTDQVKPIVIFNSKDWIGPTQNIR